MTEYVTVHGDMFDGIAHRQMGDEKRKDLLMRENPAHIGTYIFPSGVRLNIPEIETQSADDALPPWRRVSG